MRRSSRTRAHPARQTAVVRALWRTALLGGLLLGAVLLAWDGAAIGYQHAQATAAYTQAEVVLHGEVFRVDVADSPDKQALGLGGRTALGTHEGMLFVYADKRRHSFWMFRMRIPIDMIWLDNRTVVHIEHNVPPPSPGDPQRDLPTYRPAAPANFVLELAAGRAAAVGLRVGDQVGSRFDVR